MRRIWIGMFAAVVLAIGGCGGSQVNQQLAKYTQEHIQKATMMYTVFVALNRYKGPADAEELKSFYDQSERGRKGLDNCGMSAGEIDDYLVSPRDNQPYQFRWSAKINPMAGPYPVAFETKGIDGVRLVGLAGGKILEVSDDKEYDKLLAGEYVAKTASRDGQ